MLQLGPNLLCLLELVKRTRQERVSCSPFPKRQNANQLYNQSELLESSASYAGCVMFLCLPILVQDGKAGKLGRGIRSEAPETQHNASLVPPCATWWESEEQALLPSLPLHGSGGAESEESLAQWQPFTSHFKRWQMFDESKMRVPSLRTPRIGEHSEEPLGISH